jgi:hypothetical protein
VSVNHKGSEIKRAQVLVFLGFERDGKESGLSEEEVFSFSFRAMKVSNEIFFGKWQAMVFDSSLYKVHNDAVLDRWR